MVQSLDFRSNAWTSALRNSSIFQIFLCHIILLALVGYRLDLGCIVGSMGCEDETECCTACYAPVHLEGPKSGKQLDSGLVIFPSSSQESLVTVAIQTGEVDSSQSQRRVNG